MIASVITFGLLILTFAWVSTRLLKNNRPSTTYYQPNAEENIYLPPGRITGIACLLLIAGVAFASASIWQLSWPFNFSTTTLYINLIAISFSLLIIIAALRLFSVRDKIVQIQFTAKGIWVPDLQPPVRRHLFLDLLSNKKFKLILYENICKAEHRETLSGNQVVLMQTTGNSTLAVYMEDKYDANKLIKKINSKATGLDVMNNL